MKQGLSFVISLCLIVGLPFAASAADVNININVPAAPPPPEAPVQEEVQPLEVAPEAPAPLTFAAAPELVVVPSLNAQVYLVPGTVGVYFYGGFWYRFYNGFWFRSAVYNGAWAPIGVNLVPQPVYVVPPDYVLAVPPTYHRIHYNDFHRHWRDWDRSHYWHDRPWYRDHVHSHWGGREFRPPPPRSDFHRGDRGPGPGPHGDRGPGPAVHDKGHGPGPAVHSDKGRGPGPGPHGDRGPGGIAKTTGGPAGTSAKTTSMSKGTGPGGGGPGGTAKTTGGPAGTSAKTGNMSKGTGPGGGSSGGTAKTTGGPAGTSAKTGNMSKGTGPGGGSPGGAGHGGTAKTASGGHGPGTGDTSKPR